MKPNRTFPVSLSLFYFSLVILSFMVTASAGEEATKPDLPKGKQTSLGLYVTAAEAYDKWLAAPDVVKVLDVRTLEEYIYVGHAPMAWNIPLATQTHEWDADKGYFAYQPNLDFLSQVKEVAAPTDTILVMCRSGGRSAMAVNLLAENGFTNVYQITDGMEGDAVKDPESPVKGQRLVNGWKNSGAPWTYEPDLERIKLANGGEVVTGK
jgi:rhodanese-related sulfurtransferase